MNPLDLIFGQVANAVKQNSSADTPGPSYDPNPLLGALSNMFGQHAQQNNQQFNGYDPDADYSQHQGSDLGGILGGLGGLFGGGGSNDVKSSNQDPYGDPEDQGGAIDVRSSNEDPYGDPEDQR